MLPCPLRAATGVPCPLCGATRGTIALLQGDVPGALALNPIVLVALAGLALLVVLRRHGVRAAVSWPVVATLLATSWSWQLVKYATGRPL